MDESVFVTSSNKGFAAALVVLVTRASQSRQHKHFEGIQKALIIEVKEMKEIFEELEAEVNQNFMDRKCDEIERENLLIANENLIVDCLSKEVFYTAMNYVLTVSRFSKMHNAYTIEQAHCLEIEADISKLKHKLQKDDHSEMIKHFSNLKHYKELYDSIKIARAKTIEKITALLAENENLKAQIKGQMKCVTMGYVKPKVLAPIMYAIDVEPIPPCNRNKREVHLDYLKHLKESVETLREIVKEAKVEKPLDHSLASACLYTKRSQELLEYVIGTCPKYLNKRDKKIATKMHNAYTIEQARCLEIEADISKLKHKLQKDDHSEMIKHFSNLKHYKELYDSIKIARAKTIEKITALLAENENLKAQIKGQMKCVTMGYVKPKVLAPIMYAIDVEPIPPCNRNKREVHLDYLKHLKESVETLREIVKEAKVEKPLDRSLASACLYTKRSQELLEYVIGTCPKYLNKRDKKIATAPLTRKHQITFMETSGTSNDNTQEHVKPQKEKKTNVLVIPSTGVISSTEASGSKHKRNTKNNRILLPRSDNKKKLEDHPRNNKLNLKQKNWVDYSISSKRTDGVDLLKGSHGSNLYTISVEDMMKSSPICLLSKASKNKSWLWHRRLNHLNFGTINDLARKDLVRGLKRLKSEKDLFAQLVNLEKARNVLSIIKQVWKEIGKLFVNVSYEWKLTGRKFTLGEQYPLTRNFMKKVIETVRFENDHFGAIMGYGDYVIGDSVITMVYFWKDLDTISFLHDEVLSNMLIVQSLQEQIMVVASSVKSFKLCVKRSVPPTPAALVPVISTGTPFFITIDQDAPSTSHSPSSSEVQPSISHQGVAVGPTIEHSPFAQTDNDPFMNVFAPEPSFEESSSRDVSFAKSTQVI
nr:integrase, catalytic region, zinc finger, CCHC-type, peptidase aspartic, catalytic [Tanacetum cinerariifolium]